MPETVKAEAVNPDLEALRVMPVTIFPAIVPLKAHAESQVYVPLANSLPSVKRLRLPDVLVPLTVPVTGTPPKVLPVLMPTVLGTAPSGAESRRSKGRAALDAAKPGTTSAERTATPNTMYRMISTSLAGRISARAPVVFSLNRTVALSSVWIFLGPARNLSMVMPERADRFEDLCYTEVVGVKKPSTVCDEEEVYGGANRHEIPK